MPENTFTGSLVELSRMTWDELLNCPARTLVEAREAKTEEVRLKGYTVEMMKIQVKTQTNPATHYRARLIRDAGNRIIYTSMTPRTKRFVDNGIDKAIEMQYEIDQCKKNKGA